jgi:Spy/CpxP family protein refolding chaperone
VKRNWLLYLVIFSLALNLGTIGTLVYLRHQDQQRTTSARTALAPLPMRDLWGRLNLDSGQRQALRGLFPEHRRQVREVREELAQKRLELFDLLKSENPSWSSIQAKIREISQLQGDLEENMAHFLLEFKKHLRPEQGAAFMGLVQGRLCRPMGRHHRHPPGGPGPGGMGGPPGFMGHRGPGCPD